MLAVSLFTGFSAFAALCILEFFLAESEQEIIPLWQADGTGPFGVCKIRTAVHADGAEGLVGIACNRG